MYSTVWSIAHSEYRLSPAPLPALAVRDARRTSSPGPHFAKSRRRGGGLQVRSGLLFPLPLGSDGYFWLELPRQLTQAHPLTPSRPLRQVGEQLIAEPAFKGNCRTVSAYTRRSERAPRRQAARSSFRTIPSPSLFTAQALYWKIRRSEVQRRPKRPALTSWIAVTLGCQIGRSYNAIHTAGLRSRPQRRGAAEDMKPGGFG
jgi:hypothetical protein